MPSRLARLLVLRTSMPQIRALGGQCTGHVMAYKAGRACKEDLHSLESLTPS